MQCVTWPYVLRRGHSDNPAKGTCIADAINWLVHGEHGDAPPCASPVILAYCIRGNDDMPDDVRQRFLGFAHRIAGSRDPANEAARLRVLVLGALRIFAPRALDAAGYHKHAADLRSLPDDVTFAAADEAAAGAGATARRAVTAARLTIAAEAFGSMAEAEAGAWAAAAADEAAFGSTPAAAAWNDYFAVLDAALNVGAQGDAWSADVVALGVERFITAGGKAALVSAA
jgi:hypothetical protein